MNILFVCHANTSRSIMAETLLRHMLQERGLARAIRVHSAGVAPFARDGALVSLDTRFALRDHGIELADGKTSTALRRNLHLLETADLVLAMTAEQKAIVERFVQSAGKPIHTLREFAGDGGDVADPASRDESFFRETCALIKQTLEKALPRIIQDSDFGLQASAKETTKGQGAGPEARSLKPVAPRSPKPEVPLVPEV